MMEFMFPGGFAMAQMGRRGLSSQQKEELWERWKNRSVAKRYRSGSRQARSLCFGVLLSKGGIAPTARTRSRLSLPHRIGRKYRAAWSRVCPCAKSLRSLGDRHQRSAAKSVGIMGGKSIVPPTPKSALGSRPCVQSMPVGGVEYLDDRTRGCPTRQSIKACLSRHAAS